MNKFAEAKIISVYYKCETSDEFGVDTKDIKNKLNKINEEKNATKNRKAFYSKKRKSNIFSGSVGRVIITALMAASVAAFLRLDATTIREKQFFEIEHDGANTMKITVTGNEGVDNGIVSYATWDILQLAHPDVRIPQYIPSKVEIEELYRQTQDGYTLYFGDYSKGLSIKILSYSEDATIEAAINGWTLKEIENGISYYKNGRECMAYWIDGKNTYTVEWNNMKEIKKIAEAMPYLPLFTCIQAPFSCSKMELKGGFYEAKDNCYKINCNYNYCALVIILSYYNHRSSRAKALF